MELLLKHNITLQEASEPGIIVKDTYSRAAEHIGRMHEH